MADRSLIRQHKRLAAFDEIDVDHRREVVEGHAALFFSPNILTESNNIVRQAPAGASTAIQAMFTKIVRRTVEHCIESTSAVERPEVRWLGLSDAVIRLLANDETLILTSDAALYIAAQEAGLPSENFHHWKDHRPDYRV